MVGTYYYKSEDILNNIEYGDKVFVKGNLNMPNNSTVPKTFNYKKYLNNKYIYYSLEVSGIEIVEHSNNILYKFKNKINKRINNNPYLKTFILGDKSLIDDNIYDSYQKLGISHLFALSGMHVGLLSSIILKLFKKTGKKTKYFIVDIILLIYGFIVLFPASIKRCITFLIISNFNKVFELELSSIKILLLTISILIFLNINIIYDIGFIYSICTVGGIIVSKEFIDDVNSFMSAIKLSLIAFLFSMPVSLWNYHEINLLSIIYNLFYVPFVSLLVYPLSLLSLLIPLLLSVFNFLISILEKTVLFFSHIKIFNVYMGFNIYEFFIIYLLLILFILYRKKILLMGIIFIFILDVSMPYLDNSYYINYFDVGQGDSSLIVTPNKRDVILIDTGGRANRKDSYYVSDNVISYIKYMGIYKIDYLIITHGDYDHMGEVVNYINNFKIDKIIFNCGSFNDLENDLIKLLDRKKINYYSCIKELNIDKNKLYFLQTKEYDNENDNSNVIYIELNNFKFMFMGDASSDTEKEIINNYNLEDIDVLKVGHHGSKTSSSKEFIDMINPKYSIISVGKNNRYGHPNKEVLNNLKDSKIYRTDEDGSIMFKIKNNKIKIETCNP